MNTINVVAAVIRDSDKIFATSRGYGEYQGWWEFPGGKIENGETPEEALRREIEEELDCEIEVDEYIDTVEYDYPKFHLSMQLYFCKLVFGNIRLIEAKESKWLTKDSLYTVKWLPADKKALEKIKSILETCDETTLEYYNNNADSFFSDTVNANITKIQEKFLSYIPSGAFILDFGCGSGRDILYFRSKGNIVDAVDGSEELCRMASELSGIKVRQMLFTELDEKNRYDGIWACSSILHLPKNKLYDVFDKMIQAIKDKGIIYTSFKYGDFEGYRNGRYYSDFTEDSFIEFLKNYPILKINEYWISSDVRPDRGEEKWLNLILQKLETV